MQKRHHSQTPKAPISCSVTPASRLAGSFLVPVSKGPEPCADILGEQFRLFHSGEMPAASHLGPTLHIEESLSPFARRLTDILREECESSRHAGGAGPLLTNKS